MLQVMLNGDERAFVPRGQSQLWEHRDLGPVQHCYSSQGVTGPMTNKKNPNEKQPGENPDGKYHFNPGNMAGKTPEDAEQSDKNRGTPHDHKEEPAG